MAVCTDVFPAHPASLADVESQVRDAVLKEKADKLMAEKANELYQKASSMQGDLSKAAQSMGLDVKTSDDFDRQGAVEGVGPAAMFLDAFNKQPGALLSPVAIPDTRVVAKVVARTGADMTKLAAQRDAVREELKSRKARERSALFEAGLRQTLIRDGKIKIHEDVVSRLTANYRG
jgi:peptidyl-prolyl cis-trans isomerase D